MSHLAQVHYTTAATLVSATRRSGKTSIQRVVFHKMSPHETLFLTATGSDPAAPGPEVKLLAYNSWAKLEIWDFPGDYPMEGATPSLTPDAKRDTLMMSSVPLPLSLRRRRHRRRAPVHRGGALRPRLGHRLRHGRSGRPLHARNRAAAFHRAESKHYGPRRPY